MQKTEVSIKFAIDGQCFDSNPETNSEELIKNSNRGETDEDEITVHGGANAFHSKANASIPSVQRKLQMVQSVAPIFSINAQSMLSIA